MLPETACHKPAQRLLFHCIVTNLHLPHDAVFKFGLSDTERAADEFRSILPPALVRKIDWTKATNMHQLFDEGLVADPTIARLLPQCTSWWMS